VNQYRRLWFGLFAVILGSFAVLGWGGYDIYMKAPPIPTEVRNAAGEVLYTSAQIQNGQNVWQSMGGQEVGSIWGHGAYVAPDWSADHLHRQAVGLLEIWSERDYGRSYDSLNVEESAALRARLQGEVRANTHDPGTGVVTVSADRGQVLRDLDEYYGRLFSDDPELAELRSDYAIQSNAIPDAGRRQDMAAFFYWTAWACGTNRPGQSITYTNNWPHEPLIGNLPTSALIIWTGVSLVLLLAGIAALVSYFAVTKHHPEPEMEMPVTDPLQALSPTPSMQATLKYFWLVSALILVQLFMGVLTAHYGVEGTGFYGLPIAEWLPYAVTRTWHTQLAIFWIATAWLATGLFIAPAVGGHEPKFQKLGVDFLFICLLIIVVGSFAGQWFAVQQELGALQNFWFGHQGYEYVDLGRFWQIFLLIGLILWFALVVRALRPAFSRPEESQGLLALFLISAAAIAGFYAAGLMWGQHTNLAIAEYWRWWVVHLWVEGFFEVFATVVIAFLFTRMGLLRTESATRAVLFSTIIFLSGGIIGTFHHLYFSGTTPAIMALGASFSALEIVPLVLIGFEAYENLTLSRARPWVREYRWPIYFFVAVAFWNMVGAGIFGFLINPPIALYYMQGLNTTAVHAHTALFGVYGTLGMGLMLFCLKGLAVRRRWKTGVLCYAFWSINIGLLVMVLLSLLPVGILQTVASVEQGLWYARSAEFMQAPHMQTLRWWRVPGDMIFASGIVALVWFVAGLKFGWSVEPLDGPTATDDGILPGIAAS